MASLHIRDKDAHIQRLEEHIKVLEEGGDCADITETFWNIHNQEIYDLQKWCDKQSECWGNIVKEKEETIEELELEKEVYRLCYKTFAVFAVDYERCSDWTCVVLTLSKDISKGYEREGEYKYWIDKEKKIKHKWNLLFRIAFTEACEILKEEHIVPLTTFMGKTELEYYDEWGALEFLQQLIEEWNEQYEGNENLQIDMPEEGSDLEDYVEAIEQVDCHGREVVWLPCYDEADRRMVCLVGF